ncbi:uncharacterized protein KGF55_002356 [Candida pseudojiufengensis]|uniref:uncharacterized protein n=1 Tax=Candida pseudojiufengensis TaxID=497109 RepID=UPI002224AFD7|nr:uncharacterized protein KGF55_002356 [Candida pseudojiufengensis]KAI5963476.1 hypothetical protein KGF55_002356 [Candida pseudojiufengensis]
MSAVLTETNLFKPITIGNGIHLSHRIVHAPTSRSRSTNDGENFPTDLMIKYYDSRSKFEYSLIVFESCLVSPRSGLVPFKSGVFTTEQCEALKKITDKIHENKSFVSCQIFSPGRVSNIQLVKDKGLPYLAPSVIYHAEGHKITAEELNYPLKELTINQIHDIQEDYVTAAVNCLTKGGFDLVELHGTSGFLIEQFLSPISNTRNDEYGGNLENRCRFLIEIITKFIDHPQIGSSKFGIRLSAWSIHFGMNYPEDKYPINDTYPPLLFCQYILNHLEDLKKNGKEIAYVSIMEPRVSGSFDQDPDGKSNSSLVKAWSGKLIRAGGYATNYKGDPSILKSNNPNVKITKDGEVEHYSSLKQDINADDRTLIAFARPFTSNPDLVHRLKNNLELDLYERPFFYSHQLEGYLTFGNYVDENLYSNTLQFPIDELKREGISLKSK